MALIDRLARPYYGSRRMAAWLATQGHAVNRKRVQRLSPITACHLSTRIWLVRMVERRP